MRKTEIRGMESQAQVKKKPVKSVILKQNLEDRFIETTGKISNTFKGRRLLTRLSFSIS